MKIIPIKKRPLFEVEIEGTKYISVENSDNDNCNGCAFFSSPADYLCDAAHEILGINNCCTSNKIMFIKK